MLLIGRERGKGQIRKIPGPSPSKSGKSQKNRESPKKDKKGQKGRTSPDRETPPFETPPFSGLEGNKTSLRLLNALNSEDRVLKVRFSLAMIVVETFELILCQMLSSQGKNAPSNPYPHYLVRLAASRIARKPRNPH